jgi:hypothetical protein
LRAFWGDREFRDGFEIRGIREKIAKGVGKTAFAGLFRLERGLTKGYWHGELGTLEGKLHHFEITPSVGHRSQRRKRRPAASRSRRRRSDIPSDDTAARHEITLNEEEISDVNLATFYVCRQGKRQNT